MKVTGIISILVVSLILGCKPATKDFGAKSNNGIIGGTLVSNNSLLSKSVVGIFDNNEGTICTGSLLPNNLVVTAAHCIGKKADGVFIVFAPDMEAVLNLGKYFLSSPAVRKVVALKANEKWSTSMDHSQPGNDIGLMKYSGATPAGYVPATLLADPSLIKAGATALLAGYGVDTDKIVPVDVKTTGLQKMIDEQEVICDTDDATTAKQCIKEELKGPAVLKATAVQITEINNSHEAILDQTQGHAACSGDSGGPAYIRVGDSYQLWGATSRSSLGCNKIIVYTNILTYLDWIKATANSWR